MFKDTQELKDFILWCRDQRIKSVSTGQLTVEFSDYAFLDVVMPVAESAFDKLSEERDTSKTLVDSMQVDPKEEEDLLFYSSKL